MDMTGPINIALGQLRDGLKEAKLTPEEYAVVERATGRLTSYAYIGPLQSPADRAVQEADVAADLATLGNISLAKALDLETAVRNAAQVGVRWALNFGLRLIAPMVSSA